jgi:L-ornithine N5-oxygenase
MECTAGVGSNEPSVQQENCYDVVIVGFGPAALAQAISLYEQRAGPKNILIMDKSTSFSWRGQDLPHGRAKMRTNLMQDLVTARNPTSEFTFINYLWATDNLVGFTNLGLINPPRQLFDMYLEWCAKKVIPCQPGLQRCTH